MLKSIIVPMVVLIVIGVLGMAIFVCDRQDPEDVFSSCFRQRTDGSFYGFPLRCNNHRVHMQRSGRNRRRKTVPDEQDVPCR